MRGRQGGDLAARPVAPPGPRVVQAGAMACTLLDIFVSVQHCIVQAGRDLGRGATERLDGVASLVLRRRGVWAFSGARRCERPCAYFQSVSAVADKKPCGAR